MSLVVFVCGRHGLHGRHCRTPVTTMSQTSPCTHKSTPMLDTYRCHRSELADRVATVCHCLYFSTRTAQKWVKGRRVVSSDSLFSVSRQRSQVNLAHHFPGTAHAQLSLLEPCWTLLYRRRSQQNTGTLPAPLSQLCQSRPLQPDGTLHNYVSTRICDNKTTLLLRERSALATIIVSRRVVM